MKTEDLKNYIFEQLNETSYKTATSYSRARGKRGTQAYKAKNRLKGLKGDGLPR